MTITVVEAHDPSRLSLNWSGRAGERDPATTLTPFLRAVVDRAVADKAAVELECQKITTLRELEVDEGLIAEALTIVATTRNDVLGR